MIRTDLYLYEDEPKNESLLLLGVESGHQVVLNSLLQLTFNPLTQLLRFDSAIKPRHMLKMIESLECFRMSSQGGFVGPRPFPRPPS